MLMLLSISRVLISSLVRSSVVFSQVLIILLYLSSSVIIPLRNFFSMVSTFPSARSSSSFLIGGTLMSSTLMVIPAFVEYRKPCSLMPSSISAVLLAPSFSKARETSFPSSFFRIAWLKNPISLGITWLKITRPGVVSRYCPAFSHSLRSP